MSKIRDFLYRHYGLTFWLMGLSFFVFGALSLNLIYLLKTNIELFLDYGAMVIEDGALQQLFELLLYGYLSLGFYVVFKTCEHIIVSRFAEPDHEGPKTPPPLRRWPAPRRRR